MTLLELLAEKKQINGSIVSMDEYRRNKCFDCIFLTVLEFEMLAVTKGVAIDREGGIGALQVQCDNSFLNDLFCIYVTGVCNAVEPSLIILMMDSYVADCVGNCDDETRKRLLLLAMLLKKFAKASVNDDSFFTALEDVLTLASCIATYETVLKCETIIQKTKANLKRGLRHE